MYNIIYYCCFYSIYSCEVNEQKHHQDFAQIHEPIKIYHTILKSMNVSYFMYIGSDTNRDRPTNEIDRSNENTLLLLNNNNNKTKTKKI